MFAEIAAKLAIGGIDKGISIGLTLAPTAFLIMKALLAFFVVTRALKLAASGNDSLAQFFADLLEKFTVAVIIFWLIAYDVSKDGVYATLIRDWMWKPMMDLVGLAMAGGTGFLPNTNPLSVLEGTLDSFQDSMIAVITDPKRNSPFAQSTTNAIVSMLLIGGLPVLVIGLVSVIIWVAKAIIMASFCAGIVMFATGAAVGPLFIALLINERFEHYFWSWFRFMLVASATLFIAVIIIVIVQTAMPAYINPVNGQVSTAFQALLAGLDSTTDYLKVLGQVTLITLFLAYAVSQSTDIANALFSGNPSQIRSGIGALGGLARSTTSGIYRAATRGAASKSPRPSGSTKGPSGPGGNSPGGGGAGKTKGPSGPSGTSQPTASAQTPFSSAIPNATPSSSFNKLNPPGFTRVSSAGRASSRKASSALGTIAANPTDVAALAPVAANAATTATAAVAGAAGTVVAGNMAAGALASSVASSAIAATENSKASRPTPSAASVFSPKPGQFTNRSSIAAFGANPARAGTQTDAPPANAIERTPTTRAPSVSSAPNAASPANAIEPPSAASVLAMRDIKQTMGLQTLRTMKPIEPKDSPGAANQKASERALRNAKIPKEIDRPEAATSSGQGKLERLQRRIQRKNDSSTSTPTTSEDANKK